MKEQDREDAFSLALWLGYVLRNLGLAYRGLGRANWFGYEQPNSPFNHFRLTDRGEWSEDCLRSAMKMRQDASRQFLHLGIPDEISNQIQVERLLVELDLLGQSTRSDPVTFRDLVRKIKDRRPRYELVGVWRPALDQALRTAASLELQDLKDDLKTILTWTEPTSSTPDPVCVRTPQGSYWRYLRGTLVKSALTQCAPTSVRGKP